MKKIAENFGSYLGLSPYEMSKLILLADFHDIGKVALKDEILLKEETLLEKEMEEIKKHSEIGYNIARNSSTELQSVAYEILSHHEWYNGSGYPQRLAGMEIPTLARIIAIIDAYEAMTNKRPYRKIPLSKKEAICEIKKCSRTQFDPDLAKKFIEFIKSGFSRVSGKVKTPLS